MADYGNFNGGGAGYPLSGAPGNLLKLADPALYYALDFFANVIQIHLGAQLAAEATAIGGVTIANAAPYAVPFDPAPYLKELQAKLPLLAVYRKKSKLEPRTVAIQHDVCDLGITYVLPPLTPAQAERLLPALKAVKDVLHNRGEQGWDPAYTPPGGTLGGKVWSQTYADVEAFWFTEAEYGHWPVSENTWFPTLRMDCMMPELASATFATALDGIDIHVDLKSNDLTVITDLAQVATHVAPTVTAISPATGTVNGGTVVTITGTGFFTHTTPKVTIAGAACTNVRVLSATSITATTAAHSVIVGDVVVTNVDGQAGTLAAAFTYA